MRSVSAVGLMAVLLSYGLAVPPGAAASGPVYSDATAAAPQASSRMATEEPILKRASRVMHARVKSPDGKTLGHIHDLVLAPDLNSISYAAVSTGGLLGLGSTLHAVPWSALSLGVNDTYAIPISEQQFKQSRGFSPAYWPSSAESFGLVQSMASGGQTTETKADVQSRRFTRIKGSTVKASDGKNTGKVDDLVVGMDTGRIQFTIVSYGGIAGLGSRLAAVPESSVTLEPARRVARVDAAPAVIRANSFTAKQWPDMASPSYAQQLDRAFSARPPETALGYVPAEGPAAKTAPRTPTRSATLAEPTPADLTGTFNVSSITAVDGTVVSDGKFKVTAAGPDVLWLRIRTEDGRTLLVNLGPRNYISSQDFYVVRGDRIHLSGSEVAATTAGRRVLLPTEVTYDSHVLRLRSPTGAPLWEGTTTTTEGQPATTPSPASKPPSQSRSGTSATPPLGYTPGAEPNEPNQPRR
jgi:sporulation protein YlmC with PRC-barrel domain